MHEIYSKLKYKFLNIYNTERGIKVKKQTFGIRILFLVLVMVLALQVSGVVSAASVSWSSGSNYYTATVNQTEIYDTDYQKLTATQTAHTVGLSTKIITSTARSATSKWSGNPFPSAYSSYLLQAMHNAGLYETATYQVAAGTYVTVPASAATGNYVMAIGFSRASGSWSVVVQSVAKSADPAATAPTGSIPYAPTRSHYFINYRKV